MRRAAWLALAAGAWSAAWFALPAWAAGLLPAPVAVETLQELALLLHVRVDWLPATTATVYLWAPALALVSSAAAVALVLILVRWLDPGGESGRSLRWSLGTWPALLVWCGIAAMPVGVAALAGVASVLELESWALPALLLFCLTPFLALRPSVIASARPPRWWRPYWPGIAPVALGASVLLVWWGLDDAFDLVPVAPAVVAVAVIPVFVTKCFAAGWVLLAWQRRSARAALTRDARDAMRAPLLRRVAAVNLLIALLTALLAIPIGITALAQIFLQPQITAMLEARALPMPVWLEICQRLGAALADGWPLLALLLPWFFCTALARCVWKASAAP